MILDHKAFSLVFNWNVSSSGWTAVSAFLWMQRCGLPPLWNWRERGFCAVSLKVEEDISNVLQLIDLSSLLQRLIWHPSLLLLTQSSAFPKSFTPMGIFEFDKLHCLRGDKREQSWFLFKPGESVVTRHVFKQTATPGAHQKKKMGNGAGWEWCQRQEQPGGAVESIPCARGGAGPDEFSYANEQDFLVTREVLMDQVQSLLLKKWIVCFPSPPPHPPPGETQGPLECSHFSHLFV